MTVLVSLWRHPEASGKARPTALVSTWVDRVEQLWRICAVRSAGLTTCTGIELHSKEVNIMAKSEKIVAIMNRNATGSGEKPEGKLTNNKTIGPYKHHIGVFADWAANLGIKRMADIGRNGYTERTLIQKYARILRLAEIVTVRPRAMVRLTVKNLKIDENGDHIIAVRDKGGKESIQLLLPHEATIVREILSTNAEGNPLKPGERPFTAKDLGQIAYSGFRIRRAQQIEAYFDRQFNSWKNMPRETPEQQKLRDDAKVKAEALKKEWIDKIIEKYRQGHPKETPADVAKYRRKLENPSPISIRAGNRERAEKLGRPTEYDRVSVRIASVYALSHWVDETTIRNYLTK
jgi:hypothetical protein